MIEQSLQGIYDRAITPGYICTRKKYGILECMDYFQYFFATNVLVDGI